MSYELDNCPTCAGVGKVYCQINEDHRMELGCPDCGGSGWRKDAMYRLLTGDSEKAEQCNRASVGLIRITHGGTWKHTLE